MLLPLASHFSPSHALFRNKESLKIKDETNVKKANIRLLIHYRSIFDVYSVPQVHLFFFSVRFVNLFALVPLYVGKRNDERNERRISSSQTVVCSLYNSKDNKPTMKSNIYAGHDTCSLNR